MGRRKGRKSKRKDKTKGGGAKPAAAATTGGREAASGTPESPQSRSVSDRRVQTEDTKRRGNGKATAAAALARSGTGLSTASAAGGKEASYTAADWKRMGNEHFVQKRFEQALQCYERAVELIESGPSPAPAAAKLHALYSNKSAAHLALQRPQAALDAAMMVIELAPGWFKGYYRRADALKKQLRYKEALEALQQGLYRCRDAEETDASGLKILENSRAELVTLLDELELSRNEAAQENGDGGVADAHPDYDKYDRMLGWLREHGARFPLLYLKYYGPEYRGVHCLRKISPGEVVCFVPKKLLIYSEVCKSEGTALKIVQSGAKMRSKHTFIAVYLLEQRELGERSFWHPYIQCVPTKFSTIPIFFSPEQLAWLEGSFTLKKINDRLASLSTEYENVCRVVPEFAERFPLREFIWARLVVITRIFGMTIDGHKTDGLVPLADMLNHKRPRETKWTFKQDEGGFAITALSTIQSGAQVYDSYGRKCNSRFFVNYGFTIEDNADNDWAFRFGLDPTDELFELKSRVLTRAKNKRFQIPRSYKEKKVSECFNFMRFVLATRREMLVLPTASDKVHCMGPVSTRNEIAVLQRLRAEAVKVLEGFPTSIEEDEATLDELRAKREAEGDDAVDINFWNCVVMRLGEKRTAQFYVDLCEHAVPILRTPRNQVRKLLAKYVQRSDPESYYMANVVAEVTLRPKIE